jgi:hypothetical protein
LLLLDAQSNGRRVRAADPTYTCIDVEKVVNYDQLLHVLVPAVTSRHHSRSVQQQQ